MFFQLKNCRLCVRIQGPLDSVQRQIKKTMFTGLFGSTSSDFFAFTTARLFVLLGFVYLPVVFASLLSHHFPLPRRVDSSRVIVISCHVSSPPRRAVVAPRRLVVYICLCACMFYMFVCLFVCICSSRSPSRKFVPVPLSLSFLTQICPSPLTQIVLSCCVCARVYIYIYIYILTCCMCARVCIYII